MNLLNKHISTKIILNAFIGIVIVGMVFILLSVNRMNSVLSANLGFNKDSIICIKTDKSSIVLPDAFVFSSELPGFYSQHKIVVQSENNKDNIEIAHQYVSEGYFKLFNYSKLKEKTALFLNHDKAKLIYINESAVQALGFNSIDEVPGKIITNGNNSEFIICGVVEDFKALTLKKRSQPKIYQLSSEHLKFACCLESDIESLLKQKPKVAKSELLTFQQVLHNHYKMLEDIIYSMFLFINVIILLICLGYTGRKYAYKKERELYKTLGTGVHVLTLLISKTYGYLIAIIGFVVIPLAFLIKKMWLGIYVNRVNFGLIDIFIILSMALLTVYLVCCPKNKMIRKLKGTMAYFNSI